MPYQHRRALLFKLYNAIHDKDIEAFEKILEEAVSYKMSPESLKRVAVRAIKYDDIKAFSLLVGNGLSLKDDLRSDETFMHVLADQNEDAPKILKFLNSIEGYSVVMKETPDYYSKEYRRTVPFERLVSKGDDIAQIAINMAMNESRPDYNFIALNIARAGKHHLLKGVSKDILNKMSEAYEKNRHDRYRNVYIKSLNSGNTETAEFFLKLKPDLFSTYRIKDNPVVEFDSSYAYSDELKNTVTYLVKQKRQNINMKSENGSGFLVKKTSEEKMVYTSLYRGSSGRLLPFLIKNGLSLKKQFSGKTDYEFLPGYLEKEFKNTFSLWATFADMLYFDDQLPLDDLEPKLANFGKNFRQYISDDENRDRVNKLLDDYYDFCSDPEMIGMIVASNIGLDLTTLNASAANRLMDKLKKSRNYARTYGVPDPVNNKSYRRMVEIDSYCSHAKDVVGQMARNIVYPVAVMQYGLDITNPDVQRTLDYKMGNVLFGQLECNDKSYKPYGIDKVLLLTERYDIGVSYITAGLNKYKPHTKWPVYCDKVQAPNGNHIIFFNNSKKIKKAADDLSNCSFGKLSLFQSGEVLAFNVTSNPKECQSMPALSLLEDGSTRQYSSPVGYKNGPVNERLTEAWDWFKSALNRGKIKTSDGFLAWSLVERAKVNLSDIVGYELDEKWMEKQQALFLSWQRALGGTDRYRWRKMETATQLIDESGFHETMLELSKDKKYLDHSRKPAEVIAVV